MALQKPTNRAREIFFQAVLLTKEKMARKHIFPKMDKVQVLTFPCTFTFSCTERNWLVPKKEEEIQGVAKKNLQKTGQGKEKAPRLNMPCQRSTQTKQSRRREEFTRICLWSLLRSSLRWGAFSLPCPVYWRLFLGHPVVIELMYC